MARNDSPKLINHIPLRVDDEMFEKLRNFCRSKRRREVDVARDALQLLLAQGEDVADSRLVGHDWDAAPPGGKPMMPLTKAAAKGAGARLKAQRTSAEARRASGGQGT